MFKLLLFPILVTLIVTSAFSDNHRPIGELHLKKVYGIKEDGFERIPPPLVFLEKSVSISPTEFNVTYSNDFPNQARIAFDYATKIWESLLLTDIPINVSANWRDINQGTGATTLGAAGATNYFKDLEGLPQSGVFYNIVMAEKLTHRPLNLANEPDIYIEFDSEANWYFGTNGETPSGLYDFVTVALHELCHGLGFFGSMTINTSKQGFWGYGATYPFSYDRFIYNGNNRQLIDLSLFPNPSDKLAAEMVSDNLFFSGPVLNERYGSKVALYAPNPFRKSSSIVHLSSVFNDTPHQLLTSVLSTATSIHDPGLITMSIMQDIGWLSVFIDHQPVTSRGEIEDILVEAKITADKDIQIIDPLLFYSLNNEEYQIVVLANTQTDSVYSAILNITDQSEVRYFISVHDQYGRVYFYPNTAPEKTATLIVGPDNVKPVITHIPNNNIFLGDTGLLIIAEVTDLYGVDTVYVEYFYNGVQKNDLGLKRLANHKFNVIVDLSLFDLLPNDIVEYRIVAVDSSASANVAYHPQNGFHSLKIIEVPEYIEKYETTFDAGLNEFILDGFDIDVAKYFFQPALNSKHPYKNGGENTTLDFTAELIFPVKIHEVYHFIVFEEIVLVEPGEPNSLFGDDDFYDYVVVEGSKDGGVTWIPFKDGWDSRRQSIWEEVYNQSRYFNNFEIFNDLDLYRLQHIDLIQSGDFSAGDVVHIRFRLLSDPYDVGWGWAIDNLKIQTEDLNEIDPNTNAVALKNPLFRVYPNPVLSNEINIEGIDDVVKRVRVYNSMGKLVYHQKGISKDHRITLPNLMNGLHILYLESDNKVYTTKIQIK